ncbi:hypothetical protein ACQPXH_00170 [Nocardia sp. CA-135953]|uniref:hypothetical protein n=1 Tax=Nocardia sp. CA-135953 TaxID=3239978 RepID=UPI003D992412
MLTDIGPDELLTGATRLRRSHHATRKEELCLIRMLSNLIGNSVPNPARHNPAFTPALLRPDPAVVIQTLSNPTPR